MVRTLSLLSLSRARARFFSLVRNFSSWNSARSLFGSIKNLRVFFASLFSFLFVRSSVMKKNWRASKERELERKRKKSSRKIRRRRRLMRCSLKIDSGVNEREGKRSRRIEKARIYLLTPTSKEKFFLARVWQKQKRFIIILMTDKYYMTSSVSLSSLTVLLHVTANPQISN